MKAIIYIPIEDISKKVEDLSEWYTTPDHTTKKLVQIIIDTDILVNMIDNGKPAGLQQINSMFDGVIHERNPDTGQIRSRKSGDYGNEVYYDADKGDEDVDEGEHLDNVQYISEEEMDELEEQIKRDEQFYVDQYNRNRDIKDHVKSIDEIIKS